MPVYIFAYLPAAAAAVAAGVAAAAAASASAVIIAYIGRTLFPCIHNQVGRACEGALYAPCLWEGTEDTLRTMYTK